MIWISNTNRRWKIGKLKPMHQQYVQKRKAKIRMPVTKIVEVLLRIFRKFIHLVTLKVH